MIFSLPGHLHLTKVTPGFPLVVTISSMENGVGDKKTRAAARFQWRECVIAGADQVSGVTKRGYTVGVGPLPRSSAALIHSASIGPLRSKGLWR
jgi:hypothetical protein